MQQPIERSESRRIKPPRVVDSDHYSPKVKLILAKEYCENDSARSSAIASTR